MKLTVKTSLTIIAILSFAILVTSLLNYYKYQSTLSELVRSRLVVVGLDLKHTIEGSIGLGIPLSQTENIQEIIDRTKKEDDQVLSVEVYETSAAGGSKLFHTDRSGIGKPVPGDWLTAAKSAEKDIWSADDAKAMITGFSLLNNFNKVIGAVVLRYSKAGQTTKIDAMFRKLAKASGVVLVGVSALTFLGVFMFFRQISSSFGRMTESLNALITGEPPTLTGDTAATEEEAHFVRFQEKTGALLKIVTEAKQTMPPAEKPAEEKG